MTDALGHTASTRKLSIVARGRQLGTAAHMLSDRDQVIMKAADLQRQLIVITAGLAGERIAFGEVSTSINDDLHAATALARSMVTSFGMSEALGLVTIGEKGGEVFLGASLQDLGSVGPETLNLIDNEVERLVGDAEARADGGPRPQLEHASRRRRRRCSSTRRFPAWRSTRCSRRSPRCRSRSSARCAAPRRCASRHAIPSRANESSTVATSTSPAMIVALIALVFSTTGLADGARNAVISAIAGHPVSAKPHAGGILLLGSNRKFPASAIPTVRNASRLDGKTAEEIAGTCPPATVEVGSWCIDTAPYPLTKADAGKNNFIWASKACEAEGGWLPAASELLGAAGLIKLESTIHDSPLTATVNLDPSRGLKDEREMSSTLVTTEAGSAAAGFEGVSEGATGDPRQGQANPVPLPANPLPESLQYVTVYDNHNAGGFAGSEPVADPENFRCAFNKTTGAVNKAES